MKGQPDSPNRYERGVGLAAEGRHAEALALMEQHLRDEPADGQALNDAGAILYAMGRLPEAADMLARAADHLDADRGQALWNLAEVYLAANRPADAADLFAPLAGAGLLSADLVNRTGALFIDGGDLDGAAEALIRSLRMCAEQEILVPILDVVRSKRAKVAFFCENGDAKFMRDIFAHVNARFTAKMYRGTSDEQMRETLEWCDVAWFEWCTDQVVRATKMPRTCRIITRLHRYEAFRSWPEEVDWRNVDALVTVGNGAVLEHLVNRVPHLYDCTRVVPIPNGVDLDKFAFIDRKRGKNLAVVAHINYWKNSMLLIQCFAKLHEIDPDYRLYFAGPFQDDGSLRNYLAYMIRELNLQDSVLFEGWQDDVAGWLEDKHYLVSGSLVEGLPVNVLEAMARGLKPLIHTFPGSRDLFPPQLLFRTVDEFCKRVLEEPYEPRAYRDYVAERYSLEDQLRAVKDLIVEMEQAGPPDGPGAAFDGRSPASAPEPPAEDRIVQAVAALGADGLRILLLGCPASQADARLSGYGELTGIDPDDDNVSAAMDACPEGAFICGDLHATRLGDGSFDVIVSRNTLGDGSYGRPADYMALTARLLRPGGTLLLSADASSAEGADDLASEAGLGVAAFDRPEGGQTAFLQGFKRR